MKKNLILMMLLLTGAVSMIGQEISDPIMVVTGNVVNTGTLISNGPIDLRKNAAGAGQIDNKETGDIKTPALTVGEGTTLNNLAGGEICIGCEVEAAKKCDGLVIENGAYNNGAAETTYAGPFDASWAPTAFTPTGKDLCVYKKDPRIEGNRYTNWSDAKTNCENGTYADGESTAGWRLPNLMELQMLYLQLGGNGGSAIGSAAIFGGGDDAEALINTAYWSSTAFVGDNKSAFFLIFQSGFRQFNGIESSYHVRCVKSM